MRLKHFVFVAFLAVVAGCGCPSPAQTARSGSADGGTAAEVTEPVVDALEEVREPEAADVAPDAVEAAATDAAGADAVALEQGETLAGAFVAAGGQALCEAAVYALNPDWRMNACDGLEEDRASRCRRQRAPVRAFVEKVCATVIEESLRLDLDPLMVLAVMERESSTGRISFDEVRRTFNVSTDICEMFLAADRIVSREPGRRSGTERMAWTYGDDRRINRQAVRVVKEESGGLTIDTCAAGETGLFQLLPNNYGRGKLVQATGQRLAGTAAQRREAVLGDPVLQVRLGCQELARHRDLYPEAERSGWYYAWLGVYNVGSTVRGEKWHAYTEKVSRHYLAACSRGYIQVDGSPVPALIRDVWPPCGVVEIWLRQREDLRRREEAAE